MFKRTYLSLLVAALLPYSASAVTVDAQSSGRTEEIAVKKANLSALRATMTEIRGEKFLQDHIKEIRAKVILKVDDFVTDTKIVSSETDEKGNVKISTKVEVDDQKLTAVLQEISGDENSVAQANSTSGGSGETPKDNNNSGSQIASNTDSSNNTNNADKNGTSENETPPQDPSGNNTTTEQSDVANQVNEKLQELAKINPREVNSLEDTMKFTHLLRSAQISQIQHLFDILSNSYKITLKNIGQLDNYSEKELYSVSDDESELYTFTLTNKYSIGAVDTAVKASEEFYQRLDLDDNFTNLFKEIIHNSRHTYSLIEDRFTSLFSINEGSVKDMKWQPATVKVITYNQSKFQNEYDVNFDIPEFIKNDEAGKPSCIMQGGKGDIENRPNSFSFSSNVKFFDLKDSDVELKLENYIHNMGIIASADQPPHTYDMIFKYNFDQLSSTEKHGSSDAKGIAVKMTSKNVNIEPILERCKGQLNLPPSFLSSQLCVALYDKDKRFTDIIIPSLKKSPNFELEFTNTGDQLNLSAISESDVFLIKKYNVGVSGKPNKIEFKAGFDDFLLSEEGQKLNINNFNFTTGFLSSVDKKPNNFDFEQAISFDKFFFQSGNYDVDGSKLNIALRNLDFTPFKSYCKFKDEEELNLYTAIACAIGGNNEEDVFVPFLQIFKYETLGNIDFATVLNGSKVNLTAKIFVNPEFKLEKYEELFSTGLVLDADLTVDKSVFEKSQYQLESIGAMARQYVPDPEASQYKLHIVLKNGVLTINDKEVQ